MNPQELLTKKITIGVTGFARAGKTVFIGSVVQALMTSDAWKSRPGQGPLAQFAPLERETFVRARVRDDINTDSPQFPYRKVRDSLTGAKGDWPEPTEGVSRIVVDLEYKSKTVIWDTVDTLRLEFVDYPGEWLIDLPMLKQDYWDWSEKMLELAKKPSRIGLSKDYVQAINRLPGNPPFSEETVERLSELWTEYLKASAAAGLTFNQPGRALRPDKLRHSPILRLFPSPRGLRDTAFGNEQAKRFEEYKKKVIRPFYQNLFARMDRQVVLVDVLRTIEQGEEVFADMLDSLSTTMKSFRYGKGDILSWLAGRKTTHVLFAATKSDHVTRGDRYNLEQVLRRMVSVIDDCNHMRSQALGHGFVSMASVRATEDRKTNNQPVREVLYGHPEDESDAGQWDPGGLPLDMPPIWEELHFRFMKFRPSPMADAVHQGFPAINLGKTLNFLIGDEF